MAPNPTPLAARRILIVDDQESIRDILRTALTEAGAVVLEAGGGAAGVEMATRQGPDLILLDIAMPGMNGWQVLEALRSIAETASIPVVLETSSGDFPSYEQARRHSVAAFISKPFRLMDVVETCRRILAGARPLMGQAAEDAPAASVQVRDRNDRLLAVGTLVDADGGGAQIEIDAALGQGQQVVMTVLSAAGPQRYQAEVRWVSSDGGRFVHGLRFQK
ncbi:MAG TPA: response regulator [Vicinamibacteria bacterium]|nr:response regulator [Vicinamibacteria bacterium]